MPRQFWKNPKPTLRSSLLPNGDSAADGFGDPFKGSFGGSGFFSGSFFSGLGGGGGADLSSFCGGSLDFSGFGSELVGCSGGAGSLGSCFASCCPPPPAAPGSSLTSSCPTVTVSSSFARNSLMTPASGALTATSICREAQQ